jgi:hypothetical protein
MSPLVQGGRRRAWEALGNTMSKAIGFALVLAGVALAVGTLSGGQPPAPAPDHSIEIATLPAAAAPPAAAIARGAAPATAPGKGAEAPLPGATPAPVIVTLAPRAQGVRLRPARAALPDRASLALVLQRELRRVGCYGGEINGVWTQATQQAMRAFTDRVNASLPVAQPDDILLSLVAAQTDPVCGRQCPAGQGLSAEGRCLPSAILARRPPPIAGALAKSPPAAAPPVITGWSTSPSAAPAHTPLAPPEGRMALLGPTPEVMPTSAPLRLAPPVAAGAPAANRALRPPQARRSNWAQRLFRHGSSPF